MWLVRLVYVGVYFILVSMLRFSCYLHNKTLSGSFCYFKVPLKHCCNRQQYVFVHCVTPNCFFYLSVLSQMLHFLRHWPCFHLVLRCDFSDPITSGQPRLKLFLTVSNVPPVTSAVWISFRPFHFPLISSHATSHILLTEQTHVMWLQAIGKWSKYNDLKSSLCVFQLIRYKSFASVQTYLTTWASKL